MLPGKTWQKGSACIDGRTDHSQVNASKNDCKKTALRRLLVNISREHPYLPLILNFDDLYSDDPTIKLVKSFGYQFIMVIKGSTHESLYQSVDELDVADKVVGYQYNDEKGFTHWFRFVNGVPINKSHQEVLVNYLEYVEIDPESNEKYVNTWIADIVLSTDSVTKVMRGARAKWKIEYETFNTLKTQGYHLEYNYGHGKQHLARNLACLTITAFLINQIEQLPCKLQEAFKSKKSKKALWHAIRGLFDWFCIDNWADAFTAIIDGRSVSLKLLTVDTT